MSLLCGVLITSFLIDNLLSFSSLLDLGGFASSSFSTFMLFLGGSLSVPLEKSSTLETSSHDFFDSCLM